ncbi:MAG: exopolysaccharide biosynthesis protein [Paracraurococcus sp.]
MPSPMPDHLPPAPPPVLTEKGSEGHGQSSSSISGIVAGVAEAFPGERISLGDMVEAFGERAFGLLILLLCLPSLLPGAATVFGLPMLVLGAQMGLGLRNPRLPAFMARQTLKRTDLLRLASVSSGPLRRVERLVHPRDGWFTSPMGERLVGWLTVYTALMLILPGPGTNGPPAFGTIVMALGVVEQDSRVTGWGVGLTIAGCLFATAVVVAICLFGAAAFAWLF